jgi:putative aldouronate transport system substrate-binding protein
MMKKSLIKALCIVCMASVLAGCNVKKDPKPVAGEDNTPKKVRMFVSDNTDVVPSKPSMEIDEIKHMAEKSGVELDVVFLAHGNYRETLRLKFASGDFPDMYQFWGISEAEPITNGLAEELNSLLDKHGQNLKKAIPESSWNGVTVKGKIMAVPQPPAGNAPAERTLIARIDWMKKLNLELPKTSDDLLKVLRAFRDNDPNGNGQKDEIPFSSRANFEWMDNIFGMWGINITTFHVHEGKAIPGTVHPNMKKALEFIRTMYSEKLLDSEFLNNNRTVWQQKVYSDRVGMVNTVTPGMGGWHIEIGAALPGKNAELSAIPTPRGTGYSGPVGRVEQPVGQTWIFFKDSKNKEAGIKFLDWLATEEGNMFARYGFEGKALTKVDGKLHYDTTKEKEFQVGWRSKVFRLVDIDSVRNAVVQDPIKLQKDDEAYTISKKEGIPNPFYSMAVPKELLSKPDLNWNGSLFQEAAAKIITGAKPLEYFDEFVDTWYKQGGDAVVKEATDWYNNNK